MTKRIICALWSVLLFCFSATAGVIKGTVADSSTGSPLGGVIIGIPALGIGAQSDPDGNFEIGNVPAGRHEVVFNYVTFAKVTKAITLKADEVLDLRIAMIPEKGQLGEVTVKSNKITNTETSVILEIRKSNLIASGVSAAQIARTMDRSAADVVKRIPGVTLLEDRFIMVRGLYDRYNTTWLNDVGAPSAELDKKSFSFDLIPSGQLDRIMVYKTPSAELPGDFAGGMVKLYTSSLPDKSQISGGLQFSFREHSTGTSFNYNPRGKTDWLGYDDGQRSIPANAPGYIARGDENIEQISKSFRNNWKVMQQSQPIDTRFNLSVATAAQGKKIRFGNLLGITYSGVSTNYEVSRKYFDIDTTQQYHYQDQESARKVTVGIMENAAISFGRNRIDFRNIYNQTGRSVTTIRRSQQFDTLNPVSDELAYIMQYQSIATYAGQLSGAHTSANDMRKYTWTLGYTDLFRNMPDYMRTKYTKNFGTDDSMFRMALSSGTVDPVNGGGRFYAQLFEKIYAFSHNFSQKFSFTEKFAIELNAGNCLEYKDRSHQARMLGYVIQRDPTNPAQVDSLLRLSINEIFDEQLVGKKFHPQIADLPDPGTSYKGQNRLLASYLSLTVPVGNRIKIVAGVRHENNIQSVLGYDNDSSSILQDAETNFLLPSINIAYNFNDKSLLRGAYGMTLNRPEFREIAPFYFYDNEDLAGIYGSLYPNLYSGLDGRFLQVAEVQNFDLRYEYYPSNFEMVQAGVFYKQFKNPIQKVLIDAGTEQRDFTFVNGASAEVYGAELDVRKNLTFADSWFGTDIFKDFTVVANAAFMNSNMSWGAEAFSGDTSKREADTKLQGQSPYSINVGLYYQNNDNGLKGSALYNVFGPRIYSLGIGQVNDLYEAPFHSLDVVLEKTFSKHYTVNLGVQNLLDGVAQITYDFDRNNKITGDESDRAWKKFKPGRYFSLGIKVKF